MARGRRLQSAKQEGRGEEGEVLRREEEEDGEVEKHCHSRLTDHSRGGGGHELFFWGLCLLPP